MKKIISLLLLSLVLFVNAQVTYTRIPMPAGYGLLGSGFGWQLGAGKPLFQNNGIIYGFTNKELTTGGWEGYLYAYDTVNNNFSIYTDTVFPYYSNFNNFSIYDNNIYFNGAGNLYKINLATNVLSLTIVDCTNYFIKNNKIFSFGGNSAEGNFTITKLKIYSLTTNSIFEPFYYEDANSTLKYYYYPTVVAQNGSDYYFYGFTVAENGGAWLHKIIKVDSYGNVFKVYDFPPNGLYQSLYMGLKDNFNTTYILNNKMILDYGNRIDTYDINTGTFSESFYSLGIQNHIGLLDNGWLYFNNQNNNTTVRTNGLNIENIGFDKFFEVNFTNDYQPTIKLNNYYYGNSNNGLNRSDLTTTNTHLNITAPTTVWPYDAFIFNNKLLYFSSNKIYSYDDITNINTELSTEEIAPLSDFVITVGNNVYKYCIGNTGYGMYKIDLSNAFLTTQENQKPTLKLYPNPTKSTLNFSEELTDIKIIDMGGKQVSATQSKTKTINVENLPKGNYLLTAKDKNGKTISEKFIKE